MLFFWLFQIVSLSILLLADSFMGEIPEDPMLLLSILFLVLIPMIIPVASVVREKALVSRSLFTRAGTAGIIVLVLANMILYFNTQVYSELAMTVSVLAYAIYFGLESKVLFFGGFILCILLAAATICGVQPIADGLSKMLYIICITGVLTEMLGPKFAKIHQGGPELIFISARFKSEYLEALRTYIGVALICLQMLCIIALLGREIFWYFESQMLLYIALGIWLLFAWYILSCKNTYTLKNFFYMSIPSIFESYRSHLLLVMSIFCSGLALFIFLKNIPLMQFLYANGLGALLAYSIIRATQHTSLLKYE